ncbi:Type VII secretion system protein EssC [Austwickia sp. TVS 96-490-7B]|nr:Type VII secretion system protein EssC [Austwickia sp. TVS 96-490-7B]
MLLLPVIMSLAAAALTHRAVYLAFGLLGPTMFIAQFHIQRRRHQTRTAAQQREHADALARVHRQVTDLTEQERYRLNIGMPHLADIALIARRGTADLWSRQLADPDHLAISVGRGDVTSALTLRAENGSTSNPTLADLPVVVLLPQVGVLGIAPAQCSPQTDTVHDAKFTDPVAAHARALIAQIVTCHSPLEVRLWLLAAHDATASQWSWTTLLPHSRDAASTYPVQAASATHPEQFARCLHDLTSEMDRRITTAPTGAPSSNGCPVVVILLIGAEALREIPGVARLLQEGPAVGIVAMCVADRVSQLPQECAAVIEVGTGAGWLRSDAGDRQIIPDGVSLSYAMDLARALAPLRDAPPGLGEDLPELVRFADTVTADPYDVQAVADRWRRQAASTSFPIGVGAGGVVHLDLRRDGPHVVVGGTTGAGTSELLRSLVASLAWQNSPERMAFVLVDNKDGSAFDVCADLPHTVGVVTDVDVAGTRRALAGLEAELRSRETLLRAAGACDIDAYQDLVDSGACDAQGVPLQALARLVVVVDEFRALVEELPEFMAGLVRMAARGRSLGLHLVLATQRPAGVVSADMRAHISLRIALRVRDARDSVEVIGSPIAAAISPCHPGRAVVRTGDGDPVLLQTTYLGSLPDGPSVPVVVRSLSAGMVGARWDELPTVGTVSGAAPARQGPMSGAADLPQLVATLTAAARQVGARPVFPPWLPVLPTVVSINDVETHVNASEGADRHNAA